MPQKKQTEEWTAESHGPKTKTKTVPYEQLPELEQKARVSGAFKNGVAQERQGRPWSPQQKKKWESRAEALGITLRW